jgi:DNA-binding NtrC family response regulator
MSSAIRRFLLVSDLEQDGWRTTLGESLTTMGMLESVKERWAVERIQERDFEVVILDATGVKKVELLISLILAQRPQTRVVVVTASPTWELARAAFMAGAVEYIEKDTNKEQLSMLFKDVVDKPPPPLPDEFRLEV